MALGALKCGVLDPIKMAMPFSITICCGNEPNEYPIKDEKTFQFVCCSDQSLKADSTSGTCSNHPPS